MGMPEIFQSGANSVVRRAFVIGNGFPGSGNQCIGLVRALGFSDSHFLYRVTRPRGGINESLHWLPVSLHKKLDYILVALPSENGGSVGLSTVLEADVKQIVNMVRETFEKDDPLLVIASGRGTISIASSINEQVPRFIQKWITPREPPDGHALVLTVGVLHQIDFAALRCCSRYGADLAMQLVASLLIVLASGGCFRVSFSNRTREETPQIFYPEILPAGFKHRPNPHMGHLAWADAFVTTADSVSIISEACCPGKPIYVMGSERCIWKLSYFYKSLREWGMIWPITGSEDISVSWSYPPLNDTAEAACGVHEALAAQGLRLRP
uniref:Uncharacterized protein n=1 Tax=Manihot esculenta TaxID=3983 RepID=A0A2C9VYD3_MANES